MLRLRRMIQNFRRHRVLQGCKSGGISEPDKTDSSQSPAAVSERDNYAFALKSEELDFHKAEIRSRTDLQNRILQIYVTTLTLIVGVILAKTAKPDAAMLIPLAASFAGMWYFDHALAIERIGTYIATDIEHVLGNVIMRRSGFIRYESKHMIDDISWPQPRAWTFSHTIYYTFLIPILAGLIFSLFIFLPDAVDVATHWLWIIIVGFLVSERLVDVPGSIVVAIELIGARSSPYMELLEVGVRTVILVLSVVTTFQFRNFWKHWREQCDSRSERILLKLAYRYFRTSWDRQDTDHIEPLVSPAYTFYRPSSCKPEKVKDWLEYVHRMKGDSPKARVTLRKFETPPDSENLQYGRCERLLNKLGLLRCDRRKDIPNRGAFAQHSPEELRLRAYPIPPESKPITIEVSYSRGEGSGTSTTSKDTLIFVDGQVIEHRSQGNRT